MNIKNWELTSDLGYTSEFTNKNDENIVISLLARSEKEAWGKLAV
ncbi:hypothetical protein V7127_22595 [Bacillus sp. JJ1773]